MATKIMLGLSNEFIETSPNGFSGRSQMHQGQKGTKEFRSAAFAATLHDIIRREYDEKIN